MHQQIISIATQAYGMTKEVRKCGKEGSKVIRNSWNLQNYVTAFSSCTQKKKSKQMIADKD